MQQVIYSNDINNTLEGLIANGDFNRVFVLTDTNTARVALPLLDLDGIIPITIPAGEENKNLDTVQAVWQALIDGGATRQSLLVNLGGGMVTDLGGFAAATFKRGIRFVNCPTTLLGAVDAAVGGKTGIDHGGLKNEIGVFAEASHVIVSACFFATLPEAELRSGFAEVLKHAMLSSTDSFKTLLHTNIGNLSPDQWLDLLRQSIPVKQGIVAQDPTEQGLRRVLNLGHTVGHAFESLALQRGKPVPHGYAVAWGLVTETVLSRLEAGFDGMLLNDLALMVRDTYGAFNITCDDYPALLAFMHRDKKSRNGEINCTLLHSCGNPQPGITITDDQMTAALDIYRDLMGI